MHDFLTLHRRELIDRCRAKASQRHSAHADEDEFLFGVPLFLDELIETLKVEQGADPLQGCRLSGPPGGAPDSLSEMGESAALHGRELLYRGYTIEQVVHDYGDLCQSVTDLAFEMGQNIETDEFRTINRCLDNAIAGAVTEFNHQRDSVIADRQAAALTERLGMFAHELRNHLNTAMLALSAIKSGNVGVVGATGSVLDRSLVGMRSLIDRSLAEVRVSAGLPLPNMLFSLADFIADVKLSAGLEATMRGCGLAVSVVDVRLAVDADRELLFAAVGNLLQNAFKFTHAHTDVTLNAYAAADRILIDVEDHCGGLPTGAAARMFLPFRQSGHDTSGLGLGLAISRNSVKAISGELRVRDVPGRGCVFTIDLPRHRLPDALPA